MNCELSLLDRKILNMIQEELPLSIRPYDRLARQLEINESELLARLDRLTKAGVIRRIGAIFDSRTMGYYSTLCACRAEENRVEEIAAAVNALPGVTHNYLRDDDYNLWFTLTGESQESVNRIIAGLERQLQIMIISMPTIKVYKIKVALEMNEYD